MVITIGNICNALEAALRSGSQVRIRDLQSATTWIREALRREDAMRREQRALQEQVEALRVQVDALTRQVEGLGPEAAEPSLTLV